VRNCRWHHVVIWPMRSRRRVGYPSQVPTLFSRKSADVITPTEPEAVEETNVRSKNYTPSKRELGVTTPKRTGQPRRPGTPVVRTKAEAKAARKEAAVERGKNRTAMMNGEESALTPRDAGPERRLVRDIVDSRRNLAEYGLYAAIGLMIISTVNGRNASASEFLLMLLVVLLVVIVTDSFLLRRRITKVVAAKMPKASPKGLVRYGIARSLQIRRMRIPKAQVQRGHKF
jgi:hypothetical protein